MDTDNKEREELQKQQEYYRTKAFRIALELIAVFGVPAFLAYFGGRRLDAVYGSGKTITLILLAVAFILSWVIVIIRTRALRRELKSTEEQLAKMKEEEREENEARLKERAQKEDDE